MKDIKETVMKYVFLLCACASILAVVLICLFLFANGIPAIGKIGIFDFLLGEKWKPGNRYLRDSPFYFRKYLCNGRSYFDWCAGGDSHGCVYGKVLSA